MKKRIYMIIGSVLLFSVLAYFMHPDPKTIILLVVIGLIPFLMFILTLEKIREAYLKKRTVRSKLIYYGFYFIFTIYVIGFFQIVRVKWWENEIVLRFLKWGGGYSEPIGLLICTIFILSYYVFFRIKRGRWPNKQDFEGKSRNLTPREIKILIAAGLFLLFALFGWMIYFCFFM